VRQAFAAAPSVSGGVGCGECHGCHTAIGRTHADVRFVVPEGWRSAREMRARARRQCAVGRALDRRGDRGCGDRLTEQAG